MIGMCVFQSQQERMLDVYPQKAVQYQQEQTINTNGIKPVQHCCTRHSSKTPEARERPSEGPKGGTLCTRNEDPCRSHIGWSEVKGCSRRVRRGAQGSEVLWKWWLHAQCDGRLLIGVCDGSRICRHTVHCTTSALIEHNTVQ